MAKFLVTGAAGFIGFHLCQRLLKNGEEVIGVDNLNRYYSPKLKKDRLAILKKNGDFDFYKVDITNFKVMDKIFKKYRPKVICHLAAQVGVRYSLDHPLAYQKANSLGFLTILELMRKHRLENLVYASSSSVYGGVKKTPFKERMAVYKPVSFYAATKLANELYAYVYHHLYGINAVGLRFFSVYGPWGRPDMAYFSFTEAIYKGEPIKVFNYGKMKRDFTYVDDIIDGILAAVNKLLRSPAKAGTQYPAKAGKYDVFNLGNSCPISLLKFIRLIEKEVGKRAKKQFLPPQPTEMEETYADISKAERILGYRPKTEIEVGIKNFVDWYKKWRS